MGVATFFETLAAYQAAWKGEESWESLEGDFRIGATCSALGQVHFLVTLRGAIGAPETWQASAGLTSELGQLPAIAKAARQFYGGA
jgi:hypothetical protein